ncbi:hypothetical protein V8C43DRAFT_266659 [Trichoderma afarasin]
MLKKANGRGKRNWRRLICEKEKKRQGSRSKTKMPCLCTHRPSLLPIEWLSEAFRSAQRGGQPPPRARKLSKVGHLEEVKVVTRSPSVNQRRDRILIKIGLAAIKEILQQLRLD